MKQAEVFLVQFTVMETVAFATFHTCHSLYCGNFKKTVKGLSLTTSAVEGLTVCDTT